MTEFFKKSKKLFWGHVWLFLPNPTLDKNEFSWKELCQFLNTPFIYHQAKILKKLMNHSWQKCQTDGRTERRTNRQRWFFRTLRGKGLNIAMSPKTVPINSFRIQLFYTIIWHKTNKQPSHGCPLLMLTLQISIYNYEPKKWS